MSVWIGIVLIVLLLEAVRIGLSAFLLLHILRGLDAGPTSGEPRRSFQWASERDRLAAEAMRELRGAMDDPAASAPAIAALDAYVIHHQDARYR